MFTLLQSLIAYLAGLKPQPIAFEGATTPPIVQIPKFGNSEGSLQVESHKKHKSEHVVKVLMLRIGIRTDAHKHELHHHGGLILSFTRKMNPVSTQGSSYEIKRIVKSTCGHIEVTVVFIIGFMLSTHVLLPGCPATAFPHHVMIGRYIATILVLEIIIS